MNPMLAEALDIEPPPTRETFRAALAAYADARRELYDLGPSHPIAAEMEEAMLAAAPQLRTRKSAWFEGPTYGRRLRHDVVKKAIGDDAFNALTAPFKARADALSAALRAREKAAKERLLELASAAFLRHGPVGPVLRTYSPGDYSTQGFGAERYAEGAAQAAADVARHHGVAVEVIRIEGTPSRSYGVNGPTTYVPVTYEVRVGVEEELDVEILKRLDGPPLREWVRLCWARGVNPRVYEPFLPHGYEERNGLDYFGRDLRKTTPMTKET